MNFRIYLLDAASRIRAAESFSAADDVEAAEVGATTFDACSDVFDGFEVWRGSTRVARGRRTGKTVARLNAWDVVMMQQENILDLEERLHRSFACIRESSRLLTVTAHLRTLWRYESAAKH
ncbi:MAG TPA: hypothetical protein VMB73_07745 [Acetobacteraceae bacterium]|jgi:hypothetical protein|nr:hypothetical protein [Acetobacteraceae bacterium]